MNVYSLRRFYFSCVWLLALLSHGTFLPQSFSEGIPEDVLDSLEPATPAAADRCVLVSPGEPMPLIVVGEEASEPELYAAKELASHFEKMVGQPLEIVTEKNVDSTKKLIVLGKTQYSTGYDISELGVEQYIIDVRPDRVTIVGGRMEPKVANGLHEVRERGVLYGTYEFLESLGVRWYRPEPWGWVIPSYDKIELPVGVQRSKEPAFVGRGIVANRVPKGCSTKSSDNERISDWLARLRTNLRTNPNNQYGGIYRMQIAHAYNKTVPPEKYLTTHPEYYALVNGERGNSGTGRTPQLCLGNPELQEVFAENILQIAKNEPFLETIAVDPEDGTHPGRRMCTCPLCVAMDDPANPHDMSNRVFGFTNIIARKIAEKNPKLKLGLYAYSSHTRAPTLIKQLEPNIVVALANINSWGDLTKSPNDLRSPQNVRFKELVKDWQKISQGPLWMREYGAYGWLGPVPMYRILQERAKEYRDLGMEGVMWPGHLNLGPQHLLLYLTAKLLWNPDLNLQEEMDYYYTQYYGPAGPAIKRYDEIWMTAFERSRIGEGFNGGIWSGGRGMHILCTPRLVRELGREIKSAQEQVKGDPLLKRRLRGVVAGYELCRRVSEVLSLKIKDGAPTPSKVNPKLSVLESKKANEAWEATAKWVGNLNRSEKQLLFEAEMRNGKVLGEAFPYMTRDIMTNGRYFQWDEKTILRKQGF